MFRLGLDPQPDRGRHDCAGLGNYALSPELRFLCFDRAGKLGAQNLYAHRYDGAHARFRTRRGGHSSSGLLHLHVGAVSISDFEISREPPLEIMNEGEETRQSFSWVRRWGAGLNLIISVAAVAALVAMFNYLAIRLFTRFHWNRTAEADLSERTQQVLKSLTNIVKVTIYWNSTEDMLLPRVKGLLKEYQFASPRIQVQYVDYTRDVAAAEKVKQDYKLPPGKKDAIIFEANGGSAVVNGSDLSDYDYSELLSGKSKEIYRTHFKGELMLPAEIYSVATG